MSRRAMSCGWMVAGWLSLASVAQAGQTYYVSTTGNDVNPGSSEQPWLTMQHGLQHIQGGDTLLVREGTYSIGQGLSIDPINTPAIKGLDGAPTRICADGRVELQVNVGASCGVCIDREENIEFSGFMIRNLGGGIALALTRSWSCSLISNTCSVVPRLDWSSTATGIHLDGAYACKVIYNRCNYIVSYYKEAYGICARNTHNTQIAFNKCMQIAASELSLPAMGVFVDQNSSDNVIERNFCSFISAGGHGAGGHGVGYGICIQGLREATRFNWVAACQIGLEVYGGSGTLLLNHMDPARMDISENADYSTEILIDQDGDGMGDAWETENGTDPSIADAEADPDQDGLCNYDEYWFGTNPQLPDTDADGMPDAYEFSNSHEHSPMLVGFLNDAEEDLDGDGVSNLKEYQVGFSIHDNNNLSYDSDGDGLTDREEIFTYGTQPLNPDTDGDGINDRMDQMLDQDDFDGDGLSNLAEKGYGTDPRKADTDGDGVSDSVELNVDVLNTYYRINGTFTWAQAQADALARGGHLATITSEKEMNYIYSYVLNNNGRLWIGASDAEQEGVWRWVNGEPWSFEAWYPGLVNEGEDDDYAALLPYAPNWFSTVHNHPGVLGYVLEIGPFPYVTDPLNPDTDGDGIPDGWEVSQGLNPLEAQAWVTNMNVSVSGATILWNSQKAGLGYAIYSCEELPAAGLEAADWELRAEGLVSSSAGPMGWTDSEMATINQRYYRIQAQDGLVSFYSPVVGWVRRSLAVNPLQNYQSLGLCFADFDYATPQHDVNASPTFLPPNFYAGSYPKTPGDVIRRFNAVTKDFNSAYRIMDKAGVVSWYQPRGPLWDPISAVNREYDLGEALLVTRIDKTIARDQFICGRLGSETVEIPLVPGYNFIALPFPMEQDPDEVFSQKYGAGFSPTPESSYVSADGLKLFDFETGLYTYYTYVDPKGDLPLGWYSFPHRPGWEKVAKPAGNVLKPGVGFYYIVNSAHSAGYTWKVEPPPAN